MTTYDVEILLNQGNRENEEHRNCHRHTGLTRIIVIYEITETDTAMRETETTKVIDTEDLVMMTTFVIDTLPVTSSMDGLLWKEIKDQENGDPDILKMNRELRMTGRGGGMGLQHLPENLSQMEISMEAKDLKKTQGWKWMKSLNRLPRMTN
jgi:hypothetical protein